jgi:hypothetical protein
VYSAPTPDSQTLSTSHALLAAALSGVTKQLPHTHTRIHACMHAMNTPGLVLHATESLSHCPAWRFYQRHCNLLPMIILVELLRICEVQAGMAPAPADSEVSTARDPRCPAYTVTQFDKTSLTNVEEASDKLWVYIIGIYAIVITVLTMLWMHYRQSINWRILYLSWLRRGDVGHTVIVKDIPSPLMPSTKGCLPKLPDVWFQPSLCSLLLHYCCMYCL